MDSLFKSQQKCLLSPLSQETSVQMRPLLPCRMINVAAAAVCLHHFHLTESCRGPLENHLLCAFFVFCFLVSSSSGDYKLYQPAPPILFFFFLQLCFQPPPGEVRNALHIQAADEWPHMLTRKGFNCQGCL